MTLRKALYLFFGTFSGLPFVVGGAGVALQATSITQAYQAPTLPSAASEERDRGQGDAGAMGQATHQLALPDQDLGNPAVGSVTPQLPE